MSFPKDPQSRTAIPCGIDEAGRGPVFGPMVVAGVANLNGWRDPLIKDSKKFSSDAARQRAAQAVMDSSVYAIAVVSAPMIDQFGIAKCLHRAMKNVRDTLFTTVSDRWVRNPWLQLTIDGNDFANEDIEMGAPRPGRITTTCLAKADATVFEVSAASCIAKVYHDNLIATMVEEDPGLMKYGLLSNKGYGTDGHASAILTYGTTTHHRKTFTGSLIQSYRRRFNLPDPSAQHTLDEALQHATNTPAPATATARAG